MSILTIVRSKPQERRTPLENLLMETKSMRREFFDPFVRITFLSVYAFRVVKLTGLDANSLYMYSI
jgi:hypothetical protein